MMKSSAELLADVAEDFPVYAEELLKIRTKEGGVLPFKLNKAQLYIHDHLEKQKAQTGKVRALILKGRQQGCSTYVGGRFYNIASTHRGYQAFILTHEADATSNLFTMTKRYHDNMNAELKPTTDGDSKTKLAFDAMDSGYAVGTAGNKRTGRSSTIQLLHGSEVAFWDNDSEIMGGALQAVADAAGTEVILESTANGVGNMFYRKCMEALRGESEYQLIFVPWYWDEGYRREIDESFTLTDEEVALVKAYKLDEEQLAWRRNKIKELGSEWLFKQEYPFTAVEAFQVSGEDAFITPEEVFDARHRWLEKDNSAPLILGVDPARFGADRTAIIWRKGRKVVKKLTIDNIDTMELVGRVVMIMRDDNVDKCFVDIGGLGAGVYDRLIELGYANKVVGVNSGSKPLDGERYKNKRAEMWGEMKEWLPEGDIPDDDELQADLSSCSYKYDSATRLQLESKDDMKKRGVKSPDLGDALALTFAQPVVRRNIRQTTTRRTPKQSGQHFMNW